MEENIWLPLINNLRQPKGIRTNTQTEKSHIPQMLRDSAASWWHRWRIKAFKTYRPVKRQNTMHFKKQ